MLPCRQINNARLQVEDMRAKQKRNRRDIIAYAIKTSRRFTLLSDRGDGGYDRGSGQPAFLAHPKAVLGRTKREEQREWQLGSSSAPELAVQRIHLVPGIHRQYACKREQIIRLSSLDQRECQRAPRLAEIPEIILGKIKWPVARFRFEELGSSRIIIKKFGQRQR